MKKIKKYMEQIKDEVHGACDYAEKYIIYKTTKPQWSQMYHDMAAQELNHAEYLKVMGQEFVNGLSYVPEECKDEWDRCLAHCAEKTAMVKLMLTK